jgi:predicted amidohydrolase
MKYEKTLRLGLIQTTVNESNAWINDTSVRMNKTEQIKVWRELKKGFINLKSNPVRPQIVVLPELTIPIGFIDDIKRVAKKMGVVVIGGLDFVLDENEMGVMNKAIIAIPQNWPNQGFARSVNTVHFGKTFFSYEEKVLFNKCKKTPHPDPSMYILDAGEYGRIGVAICSDFFDIERFVIYKGRIHHMLVIAHNMDISSYYFLCEAISRLVYCNVAICNTGFYGGSIVFSPYNKSYKRTLYKHEGKDLFTTQIVDLPVYDLDKAQRKEEDKDELFKSKPPGYKSKIIKPLAKL